MAESMQKYFPAIRTAQEVLYDIQSSKELRIIFENWTEKEQREFLDICTGVRGVKLLYDSFFKEIMNPDTAPERLEELLSLLIGHKVKILKMLPNESGRIASEGSLLIMDIVIELEDGSIANVEVQKVGYLFPGQRSACYSADLLLRQYKRVKSEKKKSFSYRDIKKVYTVILFEKSTREFHSFSDIYINRSKQMSDTGIELELLQEFVFVALDIFRKNQHNKGIRNKLDAWLAFFSIDDPEVIVDLVEKYPYFRSMYEEVYEMCRNTEKVMNMFSKELRELDRNTVQYMIDEMQEELEGKTKELEGKAKELEEKGRELEESKSENTELRKQIEELKKRLEI